MAYFYKVHYEVHCYAFAVLEEFYYNAPSQFLYLMLLPWYVYFVHDVATVMEMKGKQAFLLCILMVQDFVLYKYKEKRWLAAAGILLLIFFMSQNNDCSFNFNWTRVGPRFLGGAPTSICCFFCPFVSLPICPSVRHTQEL